MPAYTPPLIHANETPRRRHIQNEPCETISLPRGGGIPTVRYRPPAPNASAQVHRSFSMDQHPRMLTNYRPPPGISMTQSMHGSGRGFGSPPVFEPRRYSEFETGSWPEPPREMLHFETPPRPILKHYNTNPIPQQRFQINPHPEQEQQQQQQQQKGPVVPPKPKRKTVVISNPPLEEEETGIFSESEEIPRRSRSIPCGSEFFSGGSQGIPRGSEEFRRASQSISSGGGTQQKSVHFKENLSDDSIFSSSKGAHQFPLENFPDRNPDDESPEKSPWHHQTRPSAV